MKKGVWVNALLVAAMLCPTATVVAEEPTIKDLMITIEALQNRVEQLESEKAASPPEQIVERLETVEQKLEKTSAAPKPEDFRVYWKDGLRFDSNDGAFKLKLGGRLHLDFYGGDESDDLETVLGDTQAGEMFRRAYLSLSGTIYNDFEFMAEYDFAGGAANFRDVYLAMNNIPVVGQLKIGHFKEPFSLEEVTSDNNLTFIERSIMNAFSPSRNTGVQLSNAHFGERMTWAAGVFFNSDNFGNNLDSDQVNFTARVTGLPWMDAENPGRFLHLGAAFSHQEFDTAGYRLRARPTAGFPFYGDTAAIGLSDSANLYNVELAFNYDRFSFQSEYTLGDYDHDVFGNLKYNGWYVQGSAFLTPDTRTYKAANGIIDKVKPMRNFSIYPEKRGPGAWEVGLRYASDDLSDSWIYGGDMDTFTIGLNWYLNPAMRIMFNYDMTDIDRQPLYEGDSNTFKTRFQVAF